MPQSPLAAACSIALPLHPHQDTSLGHVPSFPLSAAQLPLSMPLPWLNFEIFPFYLLFCFLFQHYFFRQSKEYTVQIPQDNISKTVQLHLIRHMDLLRINVVFWFFAEEKGIMQFPELFACWWLLLFPSPNRYSKLQNQLQLEGKLI